MESSGLSLRIDVQICHVTKDGREGREGGGGEVGLDGRGRMGRGRGEKEEKAGECGTCCVLEHEALALGSGREEHAGLPDCNTDSDSVDLRMGRGIRGGGGRGSESLCFIRTTP